VVVATVAHTRGSTRSVVGQNAFLREWGNRSTVGGGVSKLKSGPKRARRCVTAFGFAFTLALTADEASEEGMVCAHNGYLIDIWR